MKISIRRFLLINLLLAITLTATITALANYYLDQRHIQRHLDALMVVSGFTYQALLSADINEDDISGIQAKINAIPKKFEKYYHRRLISKEQEGYAGDLTFQVWDRNKNLLLHSPNLPEAPLIGERDGFSKKIVAGQPWRVFTTYSRSSGLTTVVAEHHDTRNELGRLIAKDDFFIMLLTFPLSGLLIWLIIGRGLSSLNKVARAVANRAPTYLEPVDLKHVPIEIKPVIDELNELFLRLQQAFEREKRFTGDAAHELRTPLAALKTQAQVALMTESETERETALKNVIAGVDRSDHIVQQLLTLSRLEPEATHMEDCTNINLPKLAAEIIARLAPSALAKNTDIELVTQNEKTTIYANVTALSIMIRNLVDNAIRYTPANGKVKVSITETPRHVKLTVTDSGPGIPAELRSRVFERFFRVLGSKSSGSGLGLAIVQQIAKLHQAEVTLGAPEVGTGLEVEVSFVK